MQDKNKNTTHHAERHNETDSRLPESIEVREKGHAHRPTQLAKSIHATSDNIA